MFQPFFIPQVPGESSPSCSPYPLKQVPCLQLHFLSRQCTVPVHTTRKNYSDNITYYVLKKRANTTKTMRFSLITKNSNWKWILLAVQIKHVLAKYFLVSLMFACFFASLASAKMVYFPRRLNWPKPDHQSDSERAQEPWPGLICVPWLIWRPVVTHWKCGIAHFRCDGSPREVSARLDSFFGSFREVVA